MVETVPVDEDDGVFITKLLTYRVTLRNLKQGFLQGQKCVLVKKLLVAPHYLFNKQAALDIMVWFLLIQ